MNCLIKIPDYNGGFITKSIEGIRIITRDADGYKIDDQPVNYIRKGINTKFGKVIDYDNKHVMLRKDGIESKADRFKFNAFLGKSLTPQKILADELTVSGTIETPLYSVELSDQPNVVRGILTFPDRIIHKGKSDLFAKVISTKLFEVEVTKPPFGKKGIMKGITSKELKEIQVKPLRKLLFKGKETTATISPGNQWNVKGGQKPGHKYIERRPHPSGEGYIYLYELPTGKREWRDESGETVKTPQVQQEYKVPEFKKGEMIKQGDVMGRVEDVSDNLIAVNFKGKMKIINKKEHIEKVNAHQLYREGNEINYDGKPAVIVQKTENLALIKDKETNRLTVIHLERHLEKQTKQFQEKKVNKYSRVYQGYEDEYRLYNLDYEGQPEYQSFIEASEKAGLGTEDALKKKKYIKVGDKVRTVSWKYNPESKQIEFLTDGVKDYPLYFMDKKFKIRDITSEGYSLESSEGELGLFLTHEDYEKHKPTEDKAEDIVLEKTGDAFGGTIAKVPKKTLHISGKLSEAGEEWVAKEKARIKTSKYLGRWTKKEQLVQSEEDKARVKAENEANQEKIKEILQSDEYKSFETQAKERGFELGANKLTANKKITVDGRKFEISKEYKPDGSISTDITGPYKKLTMGDEHYDIADIVKTKNQTSWKDFVSQRMSAYMKELGGHKEAIKKIGEEWKEFKKTDIENAGGGYIYYQDGGEEKNISIDDLRSINGKALFEPTKESKGLISKNEPQKFYFGSDDKNAVSGYYEVVDAKDLITSHFPGGEMNKQYSISDAQNRDRGTPQSIAQINKIAANPNFDFLADNRTAQDGAPIVNQDYNVIAGNARGIGIQLHYQNKGDKYKQDILKNAERLGFSKDEVSKMEQPVLVRRINVDNKEAQRLGAISNTSQMLATEEREQAKGKATRIDDRTFNKISEVFKKAKGEHSSITEYLEEVGMDLVSELQSKGIIQENEAHLYFNTSTGKLDGSHKSKLKELLTQSILGDSSQHFEKIPDAAREGITKGLGEIFALKGRAGDLVPHLQNAVKILAKYNAVKDNFKGPDEFIAQDQNDAFNPLRGSKEDLAIFELITNSKPNEIKTKIKNYAQLIQSDMFREGLKPEEAFEQVFKPKYPKGVNKGLINAIKLFGKRLLKSVDKTKNILLPSKKNPFVKRWQNMAEVEEYINERSKEYGGKNKFLASDEYREVYPRIQEVHKKEKKEYLNTAMRVLEEAGQKEGDGVEYSAGNPFGGVLVYEGTIVLKDGVPYVKLDKKTEDGRREVKWHKGFRVIKDGKWKMEDVEEKSKLQPKLFGKQMKADKEEKYPKETSQVPEGKKIELDDWFDNYEKIIRQNPKGYITLYHGSYRSIKELSDDGGGIYLTPNFVHANDYIVAQSDYKEGAYGHLYKIKVPLKDIKIVDDIDMSGKFDKPIYSPEEQYFRIDNPSKYKIEEVDDKFIRDNWHKPAVELESSESTSTPKEDVQPTPKSPPKEGTKSPIENLAEHGEVAEFAKSAHEGKKYGDKSYFQGHLDPVAGLAGEIAYNNGYDVELAGKVAYLHDVLEDTDTEPETLKRLFGIKTTEVVEILSKNIKATGQRFSDEDYYKRIGSSEIAKVIKAADRIVNIKTLNELEDGRQEKLRKEYKDEMKYYVKYDIYPKLIEEALKEIEKVNVGRIDGNKIKMIYEKAGLKIDKVIRAKLDDGFYVYHNYGNEATKPTYKYETVSETENQREVYRTKKKLKSDFVDDYEQGDSLFIAVREAQVRAGIKLIPKEEFNNFLHLQEDPETSSG